MENFRLNVLLKDVNENKTQAGVNALFEEIVVKAQFLSVVIETEEIQENGEPVMRMPMLTAGDGKGFYPVFTDQENLEKWEQMKAAKTLTLTFDDYADMMQKNGQAAGIVINPFSHNFVLVREMIADLKKRKDFLQKGITKQKLTKDSKIMLGNPKEYPTDMIEAVKAHLAGVPQVKRAWLRLMMQDQRPSFLIIAELEGDGDAIFQGIADAARPHMQNMLLSMMSYDDGFGKKAVEDVEPFYEK